MWSKLGRRNPENAPAAAMPRWRSRLREILLAWKRVPFSKCAAPALTLAAVGLAFWAGRLMSLGHIAAQGPQGGQLPPNSANDDYSRRPVAYIYDNMVVSRIELGEFLIARFGAERLDFLVNRKIVELDCQAKGVTVTDPEVQAQLREDVQRFGPHMTIGEFEKQVLKRFNKTIYEWKEDVVRPKLAMAKLVRPTIQVTQEDLAKGFEGRYGPKVQCRMIIFQNKDLAMKTWNKIAKAPDVDAEFRKDARQQFVEQLASTGGEIPAIHKHFGDPRIEREAFSLKPGELSQVIEMPDKTAIILMCDRHVPPDASVTFESKRLELQKEIFDLKLSQRIPEYFAELRKKANPRLLLTREVRQDQLETEVRQEIGSPSLQGTLNPSGISKTPAVPNVPAAPQGN